MARWQRHCLRDRLQQQRPLVQHPPIVAVLALQPQMREDTYDHGRVRMAEMILISQPQFRAVIVVDCKDPLEQHMCRTFWRCTPCRLGRRNGQKVPRKLARGPRPKLAESLSTAFHSRVAVRSGAVRPIAPAGRRPFEIGQGREDAAGIDAALVERDFLDTEKPYRLRP